MPRRTSLWFLDRKKIGFREDEVAITGEDELLVETLYSGISHGTERLIYRGEVAEGLQLDAALTHFEGAFPFPVKYGYSNVGTIKETGTGVTQFHNGDRVFAFVPHETAYVIRESEAIPLPGGVEPLYGVFIPSLETAVNAVLDSAIKLGETVVVFGQGVVGLFITQLMRRAGAGTIVTVDALASRRRLSLEFGADYALEPATADLARTVQEQTNGVGADLIVEASGSPRALDAALPLAAFQAQILVVSWYGTKRVTLNLGEEFHRKRLSLKSSQVSFVDPALSPRWNKQRRMALVLGLLGELNQQVLRNATRMVAFEEAASAYAVIDAHPEEALQVVLSYV
ncbi:MAG TPA: zinc-binding alcohol dehydrogenase [Methanomicrobia archaeon]|nr:zinc-binding alcohol dehydrogenase [Methanomicrobia archaeon]